MKIGREIKREGEKRIGEREKVVWKNEEESDSGHTVFAFYKKSAVTNCQNISMMVRKFI